MNKINKLALMLVMFFCLVFIVLSLMLKYMQPTSIVKEEEIPVSRDRILILAPHPDDEILGCAGIIQQAKKRNIPLKIVFLTYGDNDQWSFLFYRKHPVIMPKAFQTMGLVRHDEAIEAAKWLGIAPENLIFLGYPDFKTLDIWYSHWDDRPPAESMFTHVNAVPYKNAFRPGTPYKADEILNDLKAIISEFKPTKIFLSHPSDHNPDHKSLYLFTQVALWDLAKDIKATMYPYLIHFKHWPIPRGYRPGKQLIPPKFFNRKVTWSSLSLTPEEVNMKYEALKKHHSQFQFATKYLLSFIRSNELFSSFPIIRLKSDESPTALNKEGSLELNELPEQLLEEERVMFVGVEEEYVYLQDDSLVYSIKLSRPLGKTVGASLFVFGYRSDIPFAKMPKLHIKFSAIGHKVFDQDRQLPSDTIKVDRKSREIITRIPLKYLGDPGFILTSAHTYTFTVPLDWVSWRVLEIEKNKT